MTAPSNTASKDLGDLVRTGTDALAAGDLRAALDAFGQVVAVFPDRPEGHNNLGALYSSLGELAKAESCFTRVIDLLPDNPHVLYNRGVVRSRREDYEGAYDDFLAARELAPDDADIHNNLGVTTYLLGWGEPARAHFEQALALRPDYDNAVLNLSDLAADTGGAAAAIAVCEDYLSRRTSPLIRHKLFELCCRGGREALAKAARSGEALLAADPEDTAVRLELGRLIQARSALGDASSQARAAG